MSRSIVKPPAFQFPRPSLSPSDTNVDTSASLRTTHSLGGLHDVHTSNSEARNGVSATNPDASRLRRGSSITYNNSSMRERLSQRNTNAFIVVIPPASITQEHGLLGHTLSIGPHHRLAHGLIMPLFPTMYGQLTAIAREFNFPSTTGLCLYLHVSEGGITMTPRISDESWQLVWGHVFDTTSPSGSPRIPISGKVEFDIDFRHARWYTSWISAAHREYADLPLSVHPSSAPSMDHYRGESKSISADDVVDEQQSMSGIFPPAIHSAPVGRHVPRKLSLVDRYDLSGHPTPGWSARHAISPPAQTQPPHVLSPIAQEDEPKTARQELDNRVNSWRASALLNSGPLPPIDQPSLDPAPLPNRLQTEETSSSAHDDEINLADYAWSVSSLGPEDYAVPSAFSPYAPSVHLANRLEGSVCLTPSTCTSFPFANEATSSPTSDVYRLPSPDIAYRMLEDVPLTPSTATSWGPPSSFPPSPVLPYRPPSVGVGERMVFTPPVTPSTATSWGPQSWPPSLITVYRPPSVHIEDRGIHSLPVTPSSSVSWEGSRTYPSRPPTRAHTPDAAQSSEPWHFIWPYIGNSDKDSPGVSLRPQPDTYPWKHAWPYTSYTAEPSVHDSLVEKIAEDSYPWFNLYSKVSSCSKAVYPQFGLYPPSRDLVKMPGEPIEVRRPPYYPSFDIYPQVYPWNLKDIYDCVIDDMSHNLSTNLPTCYPYFNLYPAVYPHVIPYPALEPVLNALFESNSKSHHDELPSWSPANHAYQQAAYRTFNLYPAKAHLGLSRVVESSTAVNARHFSLCVLYSSCNFNPTWLMIGLDPGKGPLMASQLPEPTLLDVYPIFNLYPAIYPNTIIYPSVERTCDDGFAIERRIAVPKSAAADNPDSPKALSVRVPSVYPILDLYPAIYPFLEIYPSFTASEGNEKMGTEACGGTIIGVDISPNYPYLNIYPGVYPFLNIYPYVPATDMTPNTVISLAYPHTSFSDHADVPTPITWRIIPQYPVFDLYPAIYPHFDLWPSTTLTVNRPQSKPSSRLTHSELHAMVMMENASALGSFERAGSMPFRVHDHDETSELPHSRTPSRIRPTSRLPLPKFSSPNRKLPSLPDSSAYSIGDLALPRTLDLGLRNLTMTSQNLSPYPASLNRTASLLPKGSIQKRKNMLERSHSTSSTTTTPPRRRDSLVFQRIRALNASINESQNFSKEGPHFQPTAQKVIETESRS